MNTLNTELRQQAIGFGLCAKWRGEWDSDRSQQELIDMWKRGIDFAIMHDYPSTDFIKANFDRTLLNDNLVYVDEHIDMQDAPSGVYVLSGECSGTLRFGSWVAATVYVRHSSDICILAEDFAKVFVRLYDNAEVHTCDVDGASINVRDYR